MLNYNFSSVFLGVFVVKGFSFVCSIYFSDYFPFFHAFGTQGRSNLNTPIAGDMAEKKLNLKRNICLHNDDTFFILAPKKPQLFFNFYCCCKLPTILNAIFKFSAVNIWFFYNSDLFFYFEFFFLKTQLFMSLFFRLN